MASYPVGEPKPSDFAVVSSEFDLSASLEPGSLMLKNVMVTCDPYMRMRMKSDFDGYGGPYKLGGPPIQGYGVSKVIKSANDKYPVGSFVSTVLTLWSEYQVLSGGQPTSLPSLDKSD